MELTKIFRYQDLPKVERELACIDSLQKELANNLERGNFATAELCVKDMFASIRDIRRLKKAKENHNRLVEIANLMAQNGVSAEVIGR